ncbi:MAG: hypothetical protein M9894_17715 [Planctomycetes bacterium]|nr:hypothetical protein [Planctomycetota bacterium]
MTHASDRQRDHFDNEAKTIYRDRHLAVLREQAAELWEDDGQTRMRGAWLELMGASGWRTRDMLVDGGILPPDRFVGVDFDPARIAAYRDRYPDSRWLSGDLLDLVDRDELQDVVVLHYDGYDAVGGPRLQHVGAQLAAVLRRAVTRHAAAAILWNADLDACRLQGRRPDDALRHHAELLARLLQEAAGNRRVILPADLLPRGEELRPLDPGFVGWAGSFEIYRGSARGHRMACLRLVLR